MTDTIVVDQLVEAEPSKVWKLLTEPDQLAKWWVPGDIAAVAGHRFHLQMPGWGAVACEVIEVVPEEKIVYTFNDHWTLTWTVVPEGKHARVILEHSGFDFDLPQDRAAFEAMGDGWRSTILPQLAAAT